MKNKLTHLNDRLFEAIDRLSDDELSPEQIEIEINRSKAISEVSSQILDIAKTSLKAAELHAEFSGRSFDTPELFLTPPKLPKFGESQ